VKTVRMAGFCEHGNEPRGCVKIRDFLTVCACHLYKVYFPAVSCELAVLNKVQLSAVPCSE
jgi:hypothetical protein